MSTIQILALVAAERKRQDRLVADGELKWNCATHGLNPLELFLVVAEEYGEVAQALHNQLHNHGVNRADARKTDLRTELIHLAAVAVAWAESIPVEVARPYAQLAP